MPTESPRHPSEPTPQADTPSQERRSSRSPRRVRDPVPEPDPFWRRYLWSGVVVGVVLVGFVSAQSRKVPPSQPVRATTTSSLAPSAGFESPAAAASAFESVTNVSVPPTPDNPVVAEKVARRNEQVLSRVLDRAQAAFTPEPYDEQAEAQRKKMEALRGGPSEFDLETNGGQVGTTTTFPGSP